MPAFGRGFFVRCARPKGLRAPWNPGRGCPPAPHALQAPPAALPGASRRGAGVPGEERPRHPAGRLGSLRSRQGAVSSPLRGCGPHQPLDPPSTRKTRQRPAQGLGGALSEWMGVKARAATAQRLGLDAQERPQRSGLVAGGALPPSRLPRGERPRRAAGGALDLLLLRAVSEKHLSAPSARRTRFGSGSEHCKRSLRKCALASLRGLVRRHPVGASRGFTR